MKSCSAPRLVACLLSVLPLACAGEIVEIGTEEGDPSVYSELNIWQDARYPNSLGVPANGGLRRDGTAWAAAGAPAAVPSSGPAPYVKGSAACGDVPAACNGQLPLEILSSPTTCGSASCHGSPGSPAAFAVDLGSNQTNLINRLAMTNGSISCGEFVVIDGAEPRASLLLNKLGDDPVCGGPMPTGRTITEEQINCLIAWVEQDATECL